LGPSVSLANAEPVTSNRARNVQSSLEQARVMPPRNPFETVWLRVLSDIRGGALKQALTQHSDVPAADASAAPPADSQCRTASASGTWITRILSAASAAPRVTIRAHLLSASSQHCPDTLPSSRSFRDASRLEKDTSNRIATRCRACTHLTLRGILTTRFPGRPSTTIVNPGVLVSSVSIAAPSLPVYPSSPVRHSSTPMSTAGCRVDFAVAQPAAPEIQRAMAAPRRVSDKQVLLRWIYGCGARVSPRLPKLRIFQLRSSAGGHDVVVPEIDARLNCTTPLPWLSGCRPSAAFACNASAIAMSLRATRNEFLDTLHS